MSHTQVGSMSCRTATASLDCSCLPFSFTLLLNLYNQLLFMLTQAQRSTVDSKRRQILILDEAVYHVKIDFNKRFLALREVKKKVCQQVAEVQGRLRHALAALGKPTAPVVDPVLKPEEMPELRDQVFHSLTGLLTHSLAH